ncbi:unnamed protein product [Enterobius vermicularis]|uniref:Chromo domain-containing protein n=1 Tax=Enterobius vermicularis TaxID=51028 RepID=A0A0N4UXW2_ENTVE|nr:unnamed protein product [Enterobius vermicularis]
MFLKECISDNVHLLLKLNYDYNDLSKSHYTAKVRLSIFTVLTVTVEDPLSFHDPDLSEKLVPSKKRETAKPLYEVERILAERYNPKKLQNEFLLKWEGYGNNENSWEPESNLECGELIKEFRCGKKRDLSPNKRRMTITTSNRSSKHVKSSPFSPSASADGSSSAVFEKVPILPEGTSSMEKGIKPIRILNSCRGHGIAPFDYIVEYEGKRLEKVPAVVCNRMCPQLVTFHSFCAVRSLRCLADLRFGEDFVDIASLPDDAPVGLYKSSAVRRVASKLLKLAVAIGATLFATGLFIDVFFYLQPEIASGSRVCCHNFASVAHFKASIFYCSYSRQWALSPIRDQAKPPSALDLGNDIYFEGIP